MADISKIKLQLKEWEANFYKVHQRKPAKDDIQQAPENIKDLYRAYGEARRTGEVKSKQHTQDLPISSETAENQDATEKSKEQRSADFSAQLQSSTDQQQQQHVDDVWGVHLNKKATRGEATGSLSSQDGGEKRAGSALLTKLGDKLFSRCSSTNSSGSLSKFTMKKVPSLQKQRPQTGETSSRFKNSPSPVAATPADTACSQVSSSSSLHNQPFSSPSSWDKQPASHSLLPVNNDEFKLQGAVFKKAMRLSTGKRQKVEDEVEVPQKFICPGKPRRQFSLGRHIDLGSTDREKSDLGPKLKDSDLSHADLGSDEVDAFSVRDETFLGSESMFLDDKAAQNRDGDKMVLISGPSGEFSSAIPPPVTDLIEPLNKEKYPRKPQPVKSTLKSLTKKKEDAFSVAEEDEKEENIQSCVGRISRTTTIRSQKSHRSISDMVDLEEGGSGGASSTAELYTFGDDNYAERSPPAKADQSEESASEQKKGTKKRVTKNKAIGKRKAVATLTRPRKRTKLEEGVEESVVNDGDDENEEDKPLRVKPPSKKSKASGVSNISAARKTDNFVRLNMKAKKFVRKGSGMTGGQWKRKQWKQKMAARSKSYGSDKCFKCGGSGHWASKCTVAGVGTGKLQPSLSEDVTPVDEQDFPSLQSAALMARGIKSDSSCPVPEADEELVVEAMVVRERREAVIVPTPVTPLSHLVKDVEDEVQKGLATFGFTSFRPGQQETISRILSGLSTLVILSTGGGKSLCYQLPAYLYAQHSRGITLVISPLVSLMEDQVTGLPPGVRGACLNSNMTTTQRDSVLADVSAGKVHFLLVSPEAVVGGGGRGPGSFPSAEKLPPIFFACIDEVHCLSEWSHNFRPSYLRLCKVLREKYAVSCFLGLTATATKSTAADVARHLGIQDTDAATVRGSPVPPNLCLSVSRDDNRDEALINLLQGKRFSSCTSIIIYCTRREQVERVATLIRTCLQISDSRGKKSKTSTATTSKGKKALASKSSSTSSPTTSGALDPDSWSVESYHAGLTAAQRKRVQKAFMTGNLRVVVATVAFGMGLDKQDVRGIVHYNLPKTFENYVQEIGRAGRDGKLSHCHVFLDPQGADLGELQRHTFGNSVDRHTLKKLLRRVFGPCRCLQVQRLQMDSQVEAGANGEDAVRVCPGHERALVIQQSVHDLDVREEGIETLLCYLELHVPDLVSNLSPVYATCQLKCYGGPAQMQAVAKKCPPVAVAIAKQKLRGRTFGSASSLDFDVIEVSDSMGWDSGPVKRELKALQWTVGETGARKSGVIVNFTDLAFRVRACGDVSENELDALLDFLFERVTRQERGDLAQLALLSKTLKDVSHKNYWMCTDEADMTRSQTLKRHLDQHFDDKGDHPEHVQQLPELEVDASTLSQLTSDLRQFIHLYGSEHQLTGRAIARVLHGIDSPRFPAQTWGRVRRFWRAQLHVHFNVVLKEANRQLLLLR